jgi:N-acetylglucosamine-6-phosphate deacetylase
MRLGVRRAFVEGEIVRGDVELVDGVVAAVGLAPPGTGLAVPGFVDLQVNGWAGVDLHTADAGARERMSAALAGAGTTAWRPTLITAPEPELIRALQGAWPERCLGVHLEGPFLSPLRSGAHPPEHLRAPDLAVLRRLLDAGAVTHVTLAPELPGALELVDELTARGVLVSAGHTAASEAEANAGFDRGIRAVTHLHNAMAPGTVYAARARPDVAIQVIVDGRHVPGDTVLADWEAARGRFSLVSDAVGDSLGGRPVEADGGEVRGEHGRLAGSRLTLAEAVRNLHALGVPLEDALAAATSIPAALADRPDLGVLTPGARADVVVLDDALEVQRVLLSP